MKNIFTPAYLLLASLFFLFTACEKEQINTTDLVVLDEAEKAKNYLAHSQTMITFAVLEMDHKTDGVKGFLMDKESNVRAIDLAQASFLRLELINMSNYYTDRMYEKSEAIQPVDVEIMAKNVKKSRTLAVQKSYETDESAGTTSKLYLAFTPNAYSFSHSDCDGSSGTTEVTSVDKIVLSAKGQINYEPTTEKEMALVDWLKAYEVASTDSN